MAEQERFEKLDEALDEVASSGQAAPSGDDEVDRLAGLAAGLRDLPDPEFKERLRSELFPGRPPQGPLARLRDWLRKQRRRQAIAAGLALAAAAAVVAAVYIVAAGGGEESAVSPLPSPGPLVCDAPTTIDPVPAEGPGDWRELALPPNDDDCFRLTASESDATGIALDATFVLEASEAPDAAALADRITVQPELRFEVEPLSDGETSASPGSAPSAGARYRIVPAAPLAEDTVYRFTILDAAGGAPVTSWAFQTQRPLRVVQTLPADQATDVPLNIGIELTFSHDGVSGVDDAFQIDPPTDGRFEVHKRTVAFVPKELQPQTLYTVTVGDGVAVEGSDLTLGKPFTFQFETGLDERTGETPGGPSPQFSRRVWESSTVEAPVLALFGAPTASLTITVYSYEDIDAFLASLDQFTAIPSWARASRSNFIVDPTGLAEVASFEGKLESIGETGEMYFRFPEPLPAGYYLVAGGKLRHAWLQVTDIATYVSVSRGRTLLWANDVAAKAPLAGATVRALGTDLSTTTGADGVAFFDTPEDLIHLQSSPFGYTTTEAVGNLVVTAADGRTAVVPLADIFSGYQTFGFREYTFAGDPSLYWRYLYTDRHLYRQTDTVSFWGLMRLRESPPPSQAVTVEVFGSEYTEKGEYRTTEIASSTVTTSAAGTFIGELPLRGVSPGYYELRARIGEQVITSTYLEVQDYVKPAYRIDVIPSRKAFFDGEKGEFAIEAAFFDGSPVPGLKLRYTFDDEKLDGAATLTTDADGRARVPFTARADAYQLYHTLNVTPVQAEEGEITGSGSVQVFPSALALDAESEFADGTATVSGTVYNVDLDRLNSDEGAGVFKDYTGQTSADYRGAPAAGRTLTASVVETSYRRVETGQTYDFIAKIVRKTYRYEEVRTSIGRFRDTSDAQGRYAISFPAGKDRSYEVTLSVTDDAGRAFSEPIYVYGGPSYFKFGFGAYLDPESEGPFAIGDRVALTMREGDQALPAGGDNRYLFYRAQNGIRDYAIEGGPSYSFAFAEEHVPNVNVIAVRFTGATYQEIGSSWPARFDESLRRLSVAVQPEKERYAPGDKATLVVTVTDADGRPVQAEVLLSAVDEAVFRLQGQSFYYDLDILDSLYQLVSGGILRSYASHQYPSGVPAAERGGGDGARDNFKDVALFQSVTTDARGRASVTFDLPDNLTSWRVTALAVNADLYAGSSVSFVPVGLPFFVDATLNTSYLTTDRPAITLRAFGDHLAAGDGVSFDVTSPTLLDEPLTARGDAFAAVDLALPALREGRHELTISASVPTAHGLEDTIVRTITVVPSRLLSSQSRFYELRPGDSEALEGGGDGLTTVFITDHNRGRYYPDLRALSWTYGDRVDQMLARNLAQELLVTYFQEESDAPAEFRPSSYQRPDGGIAIFPFADDDLVLSARVAALVPDRFGRQGLARYFEGVLADEEESRERSIIALYGLAALGDPVLPAVQSLAAAGDLSVRERLYLGLAASALGDRDTGGDIYRGLLEEFGQVRGNAVRLNVGADKDDVLEATSLAAVLGASLGDDLAPLLFEYTNRNWTKDILVSLEQISYLSQALPNLSAAPVRYAYTLDGRRVEGELARGEGAALRLSAEQLRDLDLEAVEGTVGVVTSFLAPLDVESMEADPEVSITRTYPQQADGSVTVREGALVRINLSYKLGEKAEDGCYQISDLLPSGLRPVARLYEWGIQDPGVGYPYAIEGQRVSFCAYRGDRPPAFTYYARVVGKGDYTAEPAVIQSQMAPESIAVSGSLTVEIE